MTWHRADIEDEVAGWIIEAAGHKLGHCLALDDVTLVCELDLAVPEPGKRPSLKFDGDEVVSQRVWIPGLRIHRNGDGCGVGGFIYWTGSGWIDDKSETVEGPAVEVLP